MKTFQKFAAVHGAIHNHFIQELRLADGKSFKDNCSAAVPGWRPDTRKCSPDRNRDRHYSQCICLQLHWWRRPLPCLTAMPSLARVAQIRHDVSLFWPASSMISTKLRLPIVCLGNPQVGRHELSRHGSRLSPALRCGRGLQSLRLSSRAINGLIRAGVLTPAALAKAAWSDDEAGAKFSSLRWRLSVDPECGSKAAAEVERARATFIGNGPDEASR